MADSYVYFIHDAATGLVKIGYSADVERRKYQLENQLGRALTILATDPGGRALEQEFHRRFSEDRVHGEWFTPSTNLTGWINLTLSLSAMTAEDWKTLDRGGQPPIRPYERFEPVTLAGAAYWGEWAGLL